MTKLLQPKNNIPFTEDQAGTDSGAVISFRKLVGEMRKTEKDYWSRRERGDSDVQLLRKAKELEKRVDDTIAKTLSKCSMENIPTSVDGLFFKQVASLRQASRDYFKEKKSLCPMRDTLAGYMREIRQHERYIDGSLQQFIDEDMRREGYELSFVFVNARLTIMQSFPTRGEAESAFLELYEKGQTYGLRLVKARSKGKGKVEILSNGCWQVANKKSKQAV